MTTSLAALSALNLGTNCPACGVTLVVDDLRLRAWVCTCGHHFRIQPQSWIELLCDAQSWAERGADLQPHDLLEWKLPKPYRETLAQAAGQGLNEALRSGTALIGGRRVVLGIFDFRFVGGTLSIVAGERLARGLEYAAGAQLPFIVITASGGARMQEGVLALMQMAKVNAAIGRLHRSGAPYISILTDPTFGGTSASLALVADINIAEPGASIGFTGARVIRQATYADLPQGFQSAEFQLAHGQVDMVVPRYELRPRLEQLLGMFAR
ncbi:MAG TPA: acetyl-CoA carboxylase carboxyltransferase subunit beta [Candidatus Nitrosotalea sp.]|nr:acetyl-CoA carboxylase carboxyltransferase subunit beta [Candidatus Nitrosotalea sp.]